MSLTKLRDINDEQPLLARLSDMENYPVETLALYEEFSLGGRIYYVTPAGFSTARRSAARKSWGDSLRLPQR